MDSSPSGAAGAAPRRPWIVGVSGASGTPYAAAVVRALLAAGEPVDLVVSRAARLTLLDETGHPFRDAHWREDLRRWLARGANGDPEAFGPAGKADASAEANLPAGAGALPAGAGTLSAGAGARTEDAAPARATPSAEDATPSAEGDLRYWPAGDLAAGPSSGSYPARGMIIVPASTASVAGVALGLSKDLLQRAASVTLKERRPLVVVVRETPLSGQVLRQLVALDAAGAVVLPASPAFYAGAVSAQELVDFVAGRVLDAAGVPHRLYRRWEGTLGGGRDGLR
ncbi:UbiX family flavin prenyltransferase [Streptomyces sp. SL13]|uniref:Flavin prenyltransferase UbiX n=1 Tax=Streptantibioticus silvisoli TaxID=2705255 RepID=A0AA90H862_9ACTN|nr:UbiX family flavin prenyltransferase [Streptantibioticus silvisoli]MDI5972272.1 UbiX family flavin prenyltransferase [Streptantibioticus silvisoli]